LLCREHCPAYGGVIIAYSDGMFERRRRDPEEQIAALQHVVTLACSSAPAGSACTIGDDILAALVPDPVRSRTPSASWSS
jgi:hypothetical protein